MENSKQEILNKMKEFYDPILSPEELANSIVKLVLAKGEGSKDEVKLLIAQQNVEIMKKVEEVTVKGVEARCNC
ncbi:hypothetical protein AKG94_17755 [Vibrio harveyi]|uniref:hypothetical protein n=1 Tax=Vibrio harveyi TaxID=669 RepID=UPI00069D4784|nr:hypothetical protein [Vibrio harveyi]KNY42079.1 hypothetical protein AKG94_17755 [Vibrio harveyi]